MFDQTNVPPTAMEVKITALDHHGRGVAETGRGPLAIPFTVPGDVVRAEPRGKRKGVAVGAATEIITASLDRVTPRCPYVGRCGGCPWQMIDDAVQLRAKHTHVTDV
ncbi:MAG: 23S rRNA (uracil(1939)-C(5))-methyltransferase, partial [bacterium]|nr:23S rRNA (uracil(1939)-C(5))-methyltransferase [bacterium]